MFKSLDEVVCDCRESGDDAERWVYPSLVFGAVLRMPYQEGRAMFDGGTG